MACLWVSLTYIFILTKTKCFIAPTVGSSSAKSSAISHYYIDDTAIEQRGILHSIFMFDGCMDYLQTGSLHNVGRLFPTGQGLAQTCVEVPRIISFFTRLRSSGESTTQQNLEILACILVLIVSTSALGCSALYLGFEMSSHG